MRNFWRITLAAIGGNAAGIALGMLLVNALSSNSHDKSVEAAMTAAFLTGPLGAVIAAVVAWLRSRRNQG